MMVQMPTNHELESAVAHGIRRYRRGAIAGFMVLTFGIGFALHTTSTASDDSRKAIVTSGRVVAVDGCNRDFRTIERLRNLLVAAQSEMKASFQRGEITPAQFARGTRFYAEQLNGLALPDCRRARSVLTDDLERTARIPAPLYPGKTTLRYDKQAG